MGRFGVGAGGRRRRRRVKRRGSPGSDSLTSRAPAPLESGPEAIPAGKAAEGGDPPARLTSLASGAGEPEPLPES
jgi:hypothetical protein